MAGTGARFGIVCLSPQDWHTPLPTNRQQIMLRAAAAGHEVVFVETGSFLALHLWRLARRPGRPGRGSLLRRLTSGERVAPHVRVRKGAALLPWAQRSRRAADANGALNAWLVRRLARRLAQRTGEPAVLWVYDPLAGATVERRGELVSVYDCVDDYAEQVGDDPRRRSVVAGGDERVARAAAAVFTTTRTLLERQRERNPHAALVRNVGDFAHFASAADEPAPETRLPPPVLGFAGNLLASKVDFALLEQLARARPDRSLLLVGPEGAHAGEALRRLLALPNVTWLGPRPYAELPAYVAGFDVALIPYVATAYTRSCFPLKLYEYLAAGKPVVASGLPELAGMEPDVVLADGAGAFAVAVERALDLRGEDDVARRRTVAAAHTWESRTERLLAGAREALAARAPRDVPPEATGPSVRALEPRRS